MMFMYVLLLYAELPHVCCLGVGWGGGWDVNVPLHVLTYLLLLFHVLRSATLRM